MCALVGYIMAELGMHGAHHLKATTPHKSFESQALSSDVLFSREAEAAPNAEDRDKCLNQKRAKTTA